jgi:amino acid adenylation domain-containing protein
MNEPVKDLSSLSREQKLALLARMARQKERAVRTFPVSFSQQRLWFLDRLEPGSHAHTIFRAVTWHGPLDPEALRRAVSEVVRRHEALRTVFPEVDGEPRQRVMPAADLPLPLADLSLLPREERSRRARTTAEEEARRPFDLAAGPVFRARLLRLGEREHVLLLAMHHIVSDGWSLGIVFREVTALYRAFAAGLPSPLAEPELQFPDFAAWQRERLSGERLDEELAWWRERLAGFPAVLELPTDRPRPAAGSYRGAVKGFQVAPATSEALRSLARREGCTPFMLLLAAFEVLLARCSEQERFLVGTNVAGRQRTELEGVVGFFAETLLLRASVDRGGTFRELLARVRQDTLEAQIHQELPFERLVEDLQPERDLSHHPLFQVSFVLQNTPGGVVELPGVTLGSLPVERGLAKLDLTLEMGERDGVFSGYFEYNTDLFEPETIARLADRFQRLLDAVAADPDGRAGELPLLSAEEGSRLEAWSAGPPLRTPGITPLPVHRAFEESARRAPSAEAVAFGGEGLAYAELDRRANRLARHLRRLGVGPEARVGLLLERSLDMPAALLAVLKAGGAYVPLEPGHPPDRLAFLAEDSGMRVLLTQESLAGRAPAAPIVLSLDGGERPWETETPEAPEVLPEPELHPESAAYVIYTSGSTGRPKGVVVPHRALANHAAAIAARYGLAPEDRVLQFASLGFDIAGEEIFPTWLAGAALVLRAAGLFPSFPELERRIDEEAITVANLPTVYWHEWTAELARAGARPPEPLRLVIVGTEPASPARAAQWTELAGGRVRWINAYGPTEATVSATAYEGPVYEATAYEGPARAGDLRVPIGTPLAGVRAYVLDAGLQRVPPDMAGELCLGGRGIARGYLHDPARTAASFVPDPGSPEPGARLYRTGDRARFLPSGDIDFLGRRDHQVKIRGFRIEPGEVEAALARHPAVEVCAVLVQEDGPGSRRLVAYAAPAPGVSLSAEELRAFLRGLLPEYMVPAAFAILAELPVNASGKVDRGALARTAPPLGDGTESREAPQTPAQELVAGIWAELLRRDRVGLRESFFDLGGHSLLAIQVVSRLRDALGVEVPLRAVFEDPTVAGVAAAADAALRAGHGTVPPPLVPVPRDRPLVCSFSQQRLWILDRLLPGDPVYNLPVAMRLQGSTDLRVLGLALEEMVRRHESLRTAFAPGPGGQPVQAVAPAPAGLPTPVVDLRGLPAAEAEASARLVEESVRPFDLGRGPLVRFVLFRLAQDDLLLYFVIHHIVSDGVSILVFQRELLALYGALARGAAPPPPPPVQYADFAAWQRAWLQGEVLERQLAYWRRQLEGAPVVIELPTDRPRPAVQTSHGARLGFDLPAGRVREVAALGRRERCTLFMTLQGAFNALLGRYTGQDDVLVGWPIAGRGRAELEGMIGYLANILVLRTDLRGEPTFRQLLARVREAALGAYAHQDLPFEQLVEELRPERHLSHNPVFQVFFVLNHAAGHVGTGAPPLPGVSVTVPSIDNRTTRGDLLLGLSERRDGGFAGLFEYNTDLFDAATVEHLSRHFLHLLETALARPDEPFDALPLMDAEERRQVVEGWNDTAAPWPELCVHQLFEAQAARASERPALAFDLEGETLTYGELDRRAGRLARRLRDAGVRPGVLAGVCLERSPEMVVALLAVLKAGGAYVPLDPGYPPERIAYVLADSGARVLLTQPELVYELPADGLEVIAVEPGPVEDEEGESGGPEPLAGPADLAYVIYTSGSTGRPKGVEVTHAGVVNFLATMARRPGLAPDDALLAVTTISFDIAGLELYLPLALGAKVVLAGRDTAADGALLAKALGASGATVMQATPATWRMLLAAGWTGTPGLRALCGGEALPADLAAELLPRVGELWNVYGPTETTIWSTVEPVATAGWAGWTGGGGAVSIGRPIANTTVHLLDRRLEPVPAGLHGELYIGGAGVGRGYIGRPGQTAVRFVPDPFSRRPGDRLYRTGDLARRLRDGRLAYAGRTDFQVKVRGFRIELGEIEAVLSRHPAVAQAVVAVREETPGDPRLVAWYVPAGGQAVSAGNLRAALREELPDYMIPAAFLSLPALPLTPNGKVDRKALPAPDGRPDPGRRYTAPEGPVQEKLAAIWAEVLRAGRVGAGDNFFELGGHSLLATQVLTRVQETFGVELLLRAMFENPTVAALAEVVIQKELERADADLLAKLLAELEGGPADKEMS